MKSVRAASAAAVAAAVAAATVVAATVVAVKAAVVVTVAAVAVKAGLTKAGLMYYFPSREALLWGIQEHLIVFWEGAMEAAAGKTAAEATPEERLAAYARVAGS